MLLYATPGLPLRSTARASSASMGQVSKKYPIGTVAYYGPDDELTTKIAAGRSQPTGDTLSNLARCPVLACMRDEDRRSWRRQFN